MIEAAWQATSLMVFVVVLLAGAGACMLSVGWVGDHYGQPAAIGAALVWGWLVVFGIFVSFGAH